MFHRTLVFMFCVFTAMVATPFFAQPGIAQESSDKPAQEFYELRHYQVSGAENHNVMLEYLKALHVPALKSLSIDQVGVFVVDSEQTEEDDYSIFVLTPFADLKLMADTQNSLLPKIYEMSKDDTDLSALLRKVQEGPLKTPVYTRVDTRVMRAFAGIPVIELPEYSKEKEDRMFELRLYESHTEEFARKKVHMFNHGELQVMRDVEMAPIFFGETIFGDDVPNLIYMLSAENMDQHQEHWQAFLAHPEWDRLKNMEMYKDTVSKIRNWFLVPTDFSDL